MYGFSEIQEQGEQQGGSLKFGLNTGALLKEFKFNENGGKGGSKMECADITFEIEGKKMSYRQFPITSAYINGVLTEAPNSPEVQKEIQEQSARLISLVACFISKDEIKDALEGVKNFKQFIKSLEKALPKDFDETPIDVFLEYGKPSSDGRVYLNIPKTSKFGGMFAKHVEKAAWEASTSKSGGLCYINVETKEEHPFKRGDWYMKNHQGAKKPLEKTFTATSLDTLNVTSAAATEDTDW